MTGPKKVKILRHKPPQKVVLQVLSNGEILEVNRNLLRQKWDLGLYDVVNPTQIFRGVGNLETFEC